MGHFLTPMDRVGMGKVNRQDHVPVHFPPILFGYNYRWDISVTNHEEATWKIF